MGSPELEEIPEDSEEEEEKVSPATPYEKLLQAVHDPKFSHEVALEKRGDFYFTPTTYQCLIFYFHFKVGLYKFCGDIGRGNFSRVKKAVHLLTKGRKTLKGIYGFDEFLFCNKTFHQDSNVGKTNLKLESFDNGDLRLLSFLRDF